MGNMSTSGFGKDDFVQRYEETERRLVEDGTLPLAG